MKKRSPKREYTDFIADIDDCVRSIESFTKGFDFESFRKDRKTVYAVVRAFEIIGEATRNIPPSIKRGHKDVPWLDMSDMRNMQSIFSSPFGSKNLRIFTAFTC